MTVNFAIHTPTPLMPLTQMVAGTAFIVPEITYDTKVCCFYGWGEPMADPINCKPHHVVSSEDEDHILFLAAALVALGYEAVVTTGEPDGDHTVVDSAPMLYNSTHDH